MPCLRLLGVNPRKQGGGRSNLVTCQAFAAILFGGLSWVDWAVSRLSIEEINLARGAAPCLESITSFFHLTVPQENGRTGLANDSSSVPSPWALSLPPSLPKRATGKSTLRAANPQLIVLRLTGSGQTGPYAARAGFARVFEAMSGFTNLTGDTGGPPLHMNYPAGDVMAGLFGAFAIATAVAERRLDPDAPGREIDLSATEALFRLLEPLAVEYEQLGQVRQRAGNRATYTAPSNMYATADGHWVSMVASSNPIFGRLCAAIGRPELTDDPRFATNPARVRHLESLDRIVGEWFPANDYQAVATALNKGEIPFHTFAPGKQSSACQTRISGPFLRLAGCRVSRATHLRRREPGPRSSNTTKRSTQQWA